LSGVSRSGEENSPIMSTNVDSVTFTTLTSTVPLISEIPYMLVFMFFLKTMVMFLSSRFFLSTRSSSSQERVISE